MPLPAVTIGRTLHYRIGIADAESVNRRRSDAQAHTPWLRTGHKGVMVHVGTSISAGMVLPMIVTKVRDVPEQEIENSDPIPAHQLVSGQVFLDGSDTLWVQDVLLGTGEGCCFWPPRG